MRELENILERAVNIAEGNTIFSNHLLINNKFKKNETLKIKPLKDIVLESERNAIKSTLDYYNGDKKAAMLSLKIGKTSFYEKIKKFKLDI